MEDVAYVVDETVMKTFSASWVCVLFPNEGGVNGERNWCRFWDTEVDCEMWMWREIDFINATEWYISLSAIYIVSWQSEERPLYYDAYIILASVNRWLHDDKEMLFISPYQCW